MQKALYYLSILLVLIIIILLNFRFIVFNERYYNKEFTKLGIKNIFQENDLKSRLSNLLNFFKDKEDLNSGFFNQKERLHLVDVKKLINYSFKVLYSSLILMILFLIIIRDKRLILNILVYGPSSAVLLILLLFLIFSLNFSYAFLNFHLITFSNNYWQLNPETDKLIVMFPEEFFYDITIKILFNGLITSLILLCMSYIFKLRYARQ